MKTRTEEKFFCACDDATMRAEYGPFQTAEEAEKQARMLGWSWVVCYTHVMVFDKTVDVKTAYYEIGSAPLGQVALRDTMKRPGDPRRWNAHQDENDMAQRRKCPACREGTCTAHRPDTRLAARPFDTSPVRPMSAAEMKEFASLEEQMREPAK
jgi:hypothetical protein